MAHQNNWEKPLKVVKQYKDTKRNKQVFETQIDVFLSETEHFNGMLKIIRKYNFRSFKREYKDRSKPEWYHVFFQSEFDKAKRELKQYFKKIDYGRKKKKNPYEKKHTLKKDSEAYLYVIKEKDTSFCKIGRTLSPNERLQELQVANPRELVLVKTQHVKDSVNLEKKVHHSLKKYKVRGEWFDLPDHILHNIEQYDITTHSNELRKYFRNKQKNT